TPLPPSTSGGSFSERTSRTRTALPFNPHAYHPPALPLPPLSPTLKSIALPAITPVRSRDEYPHSGAFSTSGSEISLVGGVTSSQSSEIGKSAGRLSGITAVDEEGGSDDSKREVEEGDIVLETDAQQAKVDRKASQAVMLPHEHGLMLVTQIADLEISNASLMAINQALEATKAKQSAELRKLRRLLRTSTAGATLRLAQTPSTSSGAILSPSLDHADEIDLEFEDDLGDPETEARWEKVEELMGTMRRRGEEAVIKGNEETKVGAQRVLGWAEMEENNLESEAPSGIATPDETDGGAQGGEPNVVML
ncbi:hypothetical protein P7C73_g6565, partial [Tremellales sp. Uapishka_1]